MSALFQQLNTFLDEHFPFCSGKFGPEPELAGVRFACQDLLEHDGFLAAVAPFLDRHPKIDRRAAFSVWSMYYFSHLTISPIVLWLVFRHKLALAPSHLGLRLNVETGLPEKIILCEPDLCAPATTAHDSVEGLIFDHAAPLVDRFAKFGLSPRLLWSNLAVYIDWIVRELGRQVDIELANEGKALLECECWPDGRANPLHGLLGRSRTDNGEEFTRRRICCLRYLIPETPGCGMICPLPSGRA
jgi:ferric iron reductase protein FhuF